jgi:chromate transporter
VNESPLWSLASLFAGLSLVAIGGANAAIPEMHRVAVNAMHWMNDSQFADMFALSRVIPGPNVIIVALIGFHVAGLAGAAVAVGAMLGPTCLLAFLVARTWERFKHARWRIALQAALVPLSLGLIGATAFVLARASDHTPIAALITLTTAAITVTTRVNPLWMFAAAGVIGFAGWV